MSESDFFYLEILGILLFMTFLFIVYGVPPAVNKTFEKMVDKLPIAFLKWGDRHYGALSFWGSIAFCVCSLIILSWFD